MKASNYDKIISLMDQREKIAYKITCIKTTQRLHVDIKYDGRQETKPYFGFWASSGKEASLSEKATDLYITALRHALTTELAEIDKLLESL